MPRTPHFLFSGGGVSDVHKSDVPQIDQVTGSVRSGVRPNQSDHITSLPYRPLQQLFYLSFSRLLVLIYLLPLWKLTAGFGRLQL